MSSPPNSRQDHHHNPNTATSWLRNVELQTTVHPAETRFPKLSRLELFFLPCISRETLHLPDVTSLLPSVAGGWDGPIWRRVGCYFGSRGGNCNIQRLYTVIKLLDQSLRRQFPCGKNPWGMQADSPRSGLPSLWTYRSRTRGRELG